MHYQTFTLWAARLFLLLLLVYFSFTTAYGIYTRYTAVPVWDMWNGYLEFYYRSKTEGWLPWWEQHNEHRLVLAKLFFWLDVHFFDAKLILLFVCNFIFSLLAFLTLSLTLKSLLGAAHTKTLYLGVGLFIALCFSWLQQENYTWAFQSQFHMAYLLPLWSFLALAKAKQLDSNAWFYLALGLGFSAIVTMANGVLTLPLMVVMGLVIGVRKFQLAAQTATTAVALYAYFNDYTKVIGHPSMSDGLLNHFVPSLTYFTQYLSGPLYPYTSQQPKLALLVGALFVAGSLYVAVRLLDSRAKQQPQHAVLVGLLTFVVFIGGTATSTALGRAVIGIEVPSRYMTPALLGWACLLTLVIYFNRAGVWRYLGLLLLAGPVFFTLIPWQLKAVQDTEVPSNYRQAAVALAMGVKDTNALGLIYWDLDRLLTIAELAKEDGKSIFSQAYIKNIPASTEAVEWVEAAECRFYLDKAAVVFDHPTYTRLQGWVHDTSTDQRPEYLVFSRHQQVSGYAFTGEKRLDVARALQSDKAGYAGFSGYMLTEHLHNHPVQVQAFNAQHQVLCTVTIN